MHICINNGEYSSAVHRIFILKILGSAHDIFVSKILFNE